MLSVSDEFSTRFEIQANRSQKSYRWSTTAESGKPAYFYCFKENGPFLVPQGTRPYAEKWNEAPIQKTGLRFDVAALWLRKCLGHQDCRREKRPHLPTRILDVDREEPALVVNSTMTEPYVTLSYCWGGAQPLILTLESLPAFIHGITISTMPLLFQEVITLLRALEIRFLWIDALCIIQPCSDGGLDWDKESAKMRSIYTNSLFTISAAASHSPYDGLFGWRPDRYVRVKPSSYHAEPFCVGASLHVRTSQSDVGVKRKWSDHIAALPISNRAWTLQERYLPPAVLHFDQDDACWECRSGIFDGREGARAADPVSAPDLKLILPLDPTWRMDDILGQWYNLVEQFQRRKVTDVKDRLAAFAGFAETFSTQLKSDYRAGLWAKDIHRGLLWMRAESPGGKRSGQTVYNEKAPTWSWAHIDHAIEYHLEMNPSDSKFQWSRLSPAKEHRLDISMISIRGRQGPFGAVEGGKIKAHGLLKHRVWERNGLLQGCAEPLAYNFDGNIIKDDLSLLLVGTWENLRHARALFLILQRAESDQSHFRRLGVAWHDWEIKRAWGVLKAAPVAECVSALLQDVTRVEFTLV